MKSDWRPAATVQVIKARARMLKDIRTFFDARDVIEVETPLLSRFATTDPHLDTLKTCFRNETFYLNTSPEYAMKRLLAETGSPVYQICKAFRDDESGRYHNPEFSMLEWYRPGFSLMQLMDEVEALVCRVMAERDLSDFLRISYHDAFEQCCGLNPHSTDSKQCLQVARQYQVDVPVGMGELDEDLDAWLDWLLTQLVLPALPQEKFIFLFDYPASQAALARVESNHSGHPVARRFELLYGELELANAFYELTDAQEQAGRFEQESKQRRQAGKHVSEIDRHLLAALQSGLPDCAGIAVGLDRLLMVKCRLDSIDEVMTFPWQRI